MIETFKAENVPVDISSIPKWQGVDRCGLNCLYAFMQLGYDDAPTYSQLEKVAGTIPKGGFSIAELQRIANEFGASAKVVKGNVAELASLTPPVIVHIGDKDTPGHFVCYAARNPDSLLFLDGTSGSESSIPVKDDAIVSSDLLRNASGYILVRGPRLLASTGNLQTALRAAAMLVFSGAAICAVVAYMAKRS